VIFGGISAGEKKISNEVQRKGRCLSHGGGSIAVVEDEAGGSKEIIFLRAKRAARVIPQGIFPILERKRLGPRMAPPYLGPATNRGQGRGIVLG